MKIMAVLLGFVLCSPTAFASFDYTGDGRLIHESVYDGPGFTWNDAAFIAGFGSGMGLMQVAGDAAQALHPLGGLVAATSILTWGAWRTAQHRPESVKARIHRNLAIARNVPVQGTTQELVGE